MPPNVAVQHPLQDPAAAAAWEAGRRTAKELALGKDETGRAIAVVVTCRRIGTVSHTHTRCRMIGIVEIRDMGCGG
jgi:hypothetical protein